MSLTMQRFPLARLALPCLLAITLSACHPFNNSEQTMTDDSLPEGKAQARHNPQPTQAYRITLTIANAPGPFAVVEGTVQYDVLDEQCLPPPDSNPGGATSKARTNESFALTKLSENRYEGTIYTDLMRDEDYFGRGVCHWQLMDVRVGLRATGADGETEFDPYIEPDAIRAEQAKTTYFRKELYPLVPDIPNYSNLGQTDRSQFASYITDADLFTITLTAKKVQP